MLDIEEAIDSYDESLTRLLDHLASNAPAKENGIIQSKLQDHITALLQADKRYNRALVEAKQHSRQAASIARLQAQEADLDAQIATGLQALRATHSALRAPLPSSFEPARLAADTSKEQERISSRVLMRYARILAKTAYAPSSFDPTTHSATANALFPWPSEDMMRRGYGLRQLHSETNGDTAQEESTQELDQAMDPTMYQAQNQSTNAAAAASGLDLDLFDPDQDED